VFLLPLFSIRFACVPLSRFRHESPSIDNSEWMRNGDYTPTRMQAQADAVNLVCTAKTQDNPENTVALMSFAGASPEV